MIDDVTSRPGTDWAPYLVLPLVALLALPGMSLPAWLTLTIGGVAMGMMLFLMASGLTLIFGLMDVLNFAHGGFITLGAYLAVSVFDWLSGWSFAPSWILNLAVLAVALLVALAASGALGFVFERVLIRRVYGMHLRQILITVGGLIIVEQLIVALWGANPLPLPKPAMFHGSLLLGGAPIEIYRLIAVALGLAVFATLQLVLNRTRLGLLVRAGVENREMVEALGYRIDRLFVAVFVTGAALAGIGGVMWGLYQELVTRAIGGNMTMLVFVILIIGGLGSVGGCFLGAILIGLVTNYVGYLKPGLAEGSDILLMVAILLWRPRGLFPMAKA